MPDRKQCLLMINKTKIDNTLISELEGNLLKLIFEEKDLYETFKRKQPSVVVADIQLPEVIDDIKAIKKISDTPVIVMTQEENILKKLIMFELGCEEYILYKTDYRETAARITAVLRRSQRGYSKDEQVVVYDSIMINKTSYEVALNGKVVSFPPRELELLYCLAASPNKVFTREQLLDRVWGYDYYGDTRTVDVHIERIRRKIKNYEKGWSLKTVYGVGYKFEIL